MSFSSSRLVVFLWVSLNFLLWRLTRVQAVSFLGSLRLTRDCCITYKQVGKGTVDPTVGWWCEIAMMPAAWVSQVAASSNLFLLSQGHLGASLQFRGGGEIDLRVEGTELCSRVSLSPSHLESHSRPRSDTPSLCTGLEGKRPGCPPEAQGQRHLFLLELCKGRYISDLPRMTCSKHQSIFCESQILQQSDMKG